jgi:DNA polymerase-3 subunit delta'
VAKRAHKSPRTVEVKPEPLGTVFPVPRPIPLSGVIGQERAVAGLREAVAAGRIPHAWVFHGPVGVGKFTTAMAFAAELLTPAGDLRSRVSSMLQAGTHPDLHVITKELSRVSREERIRNQKQRNIALEVIKEFLTEPAARTRALNAPSYATKVFVVDEAELLDWSSQNHLLKTLEEPPPGTVFILVTSALDELRPTVRSRCRATAFVPLDNAAFETWLRAQPGAASLSATDREFIGWFADGSPGVASVSMRTGILGWARMLEPMLTDADRGRYTPRLGPVMAEFVDQWAKARVEENERASKEAANMAAARWMIRYLGERYRRLLREAARSGSERAIVSAARAILLVDEAERQAEASVQVPFVMENLSAQLTLRR